MEVIKGEEREVASKVYPRGYWAYSRPVSRVSSLLSTSLEQDKTSERDRVSKDLDNGDAGSECKDRSRNEELKRRNKMISELVDLVTRLSYSRYPSRLQQESRPDQIRQR